MGRRSIVAAFSIFVHALVLLLLMTADLWRPISEWPTPHTVMAFESPRVVRLDDIPLPSQSPGKRKGVSRTPDGPVRPVEAAPVVAPPLVGPGPGTPETLGGPIGDRGPIDNPFGGPGDPVPPPPTIVAPQPQPKIPVRAASSGIKPPSRLFYVAPAYPVLARSTQVEGIVIIDATIDEQGTVVDARVLRSIPLLDEAAVSAVRRWKFSPTLLNGVPVPIVMTVTVNFQLTR
jgi:periplasmic protein TonB